MDAVNSMKTSFLSTADFSDSEIRLLRGRDREVSFGTGRSMRYRQVLYNGESRDDLTLSDKLVLEMERQQERSQKEFGKRVQRGNADDIEIHLVVDSLLFLLKDIIKFGSQCDRLHEMTARRVENDISKIGVATILNLTYEVFLAVVRLATSIKEWHGHRNKSSTNSLAQTVRLLQMARLKRINELASEANKLFLQYQKEEERRLLIKEVTETTLSKLPSLVREELVPALDQLKDQISERVQGIIQESTQGENREAKKHTEIVD